MISLPIIIARLALALVLGGIIGLERELSEHRAGMRTNALVALGSALFTVVSGYGFMDLLSLNHIQLDLTRIASYIVAGIGFLGGGAIVVHKEGVRGLTTAAAVWTVAAIGMACGVGFYWEAVSATLLTLFVLFILRLLEQRLIPEQELVVLRVWLSPGQRVGPLMSQIYEICVSQGLTVKKFSAHPEENRERLELHCSLPESPMVLRVLGEVRAIDGVQAGEADLQERDWLTRKLRGTKKSS
jgi:putative Mg2+ transporter-C (MgtC) family protein